MEIEYEVEHEDGSAVIKCLTKCPHRDKLYVGSTLCHQCDHFGGDEWPERNIVICNYKEEQVKSEAVSIDQLRKDLQEMLEKSKILIERIDGMSPDPTNGDDWVPEEGQGFYFFNTYGRISTSDSLANGADEFGKLYFHNVYPDFDSIEAALPDITRCNAIIRACRLVEPGFVADWEDVDQVKFYPAYRHNEWNVDFSYSYNRAPAYVSTHENCERVCAMLTKWEVK